MLGKENLERVFRKSFLFSSVLWSLDGSRARRRCTKKRESNGTLARIYIVDGRGSLLDYYWLCRHDR